MMMLSYGQGTYDITKKHLTLAVEDTEATSHQFALFEQKWLLISILAATMIGALLLGKML